MLCKNCGATISENMVFCPKCGIAVSNDVPQTTYEQGSSMPYSVAAMPNQPMKWFKFLIYFSLWAGAVLNVINGIQMLTGTQYGDAYTVSLVYATYDGLKEIDCIVGFLYLVLAVFAIYTRFRLAGFHENGPKMLMVMYAASAAIAVFYHIGTYIVLPADVVGSLEYVVGQIVGGIIGAVVAIIVNHIYFKKRQHLFVYY